MKSLQELITIEYGTNVEYIGDGAYVGFTGYSFVLFTTNGISICNEVHIEFIALDILDRFIIKMKTMHGGGSENIKT